MACGRQLQESVSKDKLIEYRTVFNRMDRNKDGRLSRREVKTAFENCGKVLNESEVTGQMISFNDFVQLMENSQTEDSDQSTDESQSDEETNDEELQLIFDAMDADGSGRISTEEVLQLLRDQGQEITDEVHQEIKQLDTNGDGNITFEEFKILANREPQEDTDQTQM